MAKRVFFSFHYKDVSDFRANVVRNAWMIPAQQGDREVAGFFDASVWETAEKTSDLALKRLINGGLDRTTVTAVLIGSDTYSRRWVRYEIMKSIERENRVIGIHINSIPCRNGEKKVHGQNPFDHLAVRFDAKGTSASFLEYNGSQWRESGDHDGLTFDNPRPEEERNQAYKLSKWFPVYDWVSGDGYNNFAKWIA